MKDGQCRVSPAPGPARHSLQLTSILVVALALTACGAPKQATPSAHHTAEPSAPVAAEGHQAKAPSPETDAPLPEASVYLDFVGHADGATRDCQGNQVISLGGREGAPYVLGGWDTGFDASATIKASEGEDAREVAVMSGTRGLVHLPIERVEDVTIHLRLAHIARGTVQFYLNGESIHSKPADTGDALTDISIDVPKSLVREGDNLLSMRTTRTQTFTAGDTNFGRVGLLLDRVSVTRAGEPPCVPDVTTDMPQRRLHLGAGDGFALSLEMPAGAEFRGLVAASEDAGEITVTVSTDNAPPRTTRQAYDGTPSTVRLPLADVSGRIARVHLSCTSACEMTMPSVVVPKAEARALPEIKNVLVYLIDTLRADKLSPINTQSRVRTPGLEAFVKDATTFARAHTQENWTKPSVATLLSSLFPWQHTATKGESVVPRSVELLPETLKSHGFYTGSFIANGYVSDRFGFKQGWDTYRNYIRESLRTPAQYVAADVVNWLDQRPQDKPFMLYVHTIDPHVPYRPPEEFFKAYHPEPYRGRLSFRRDATLLENVKTRKIAVDSADKRYLEALYDGEISYHDVHFKAILEALKRRDLEGNTMVVITSDHGEEFWDHGSVGHGHNVYQELLHIPMFVKLPGVQTPTRIESPVGLVDVMPTVLEALGLPVPEHLEGRSMLPELLGAASSAPRLAVSGFMDDWRTVNTGRYKVIHRSAQRAMLFDLDEDPGETKDLAEDNPIAVRHLRTQLGLSMADTQRSVRSNAPTRARRARPRHQAEETEIDEETRAQLRALGYIH